MHSLSTKGHEVTFCLSHNAAFLTERQTGNPAFGFPARPTPTRLTSSLITSSLPLGLFLARFPLDLGSSRLAPNRTVRPLLLPLLLLLFQQLSRDRVSRGSKLLQALLLALFGRLGVFPRLTRARVSAQQ